MNRDQRLDELLETLSFEDSELIVQHELGWTIDYHLLREDGDIEDDRTIVNAALILLREYSGKNIYSEYYEKHRNMIFKLFGNYPHDPNHTS